MREFDNARAPTAPPPTGGSRGLLHHVCTNNPFYVISAGLFLGGVRLSLGDPSQAEQTWALMSALAGYTLLLAVAAWLLVRFGNVWDDVRTVLLLVVLMFLATSVSFDEVLVLSPERGHICYLVGLLFAVAVSEGLLRGTRLRLPACFRVPYYLILGLFFLYPLAISPLVDDPHGEPILWGLFGFASAAGLLFLTLLPAARRGPDYVRNNGSPWRWPLYPWVLFGLLACAVPARAFLLCWSLHRLGAYGGLDRLVIGPYFLVPFGLCLTVLLMEIGLASGRRGAVWAALVAPVGLAVLAATGHRSEALYQDFLNLFTARLGGGPLFLTLVASAGFYACAAVRRVPTAVDWLTASLAALAFVGPETHQFDQLVAPQPLPLLAAAALQLGLGLWRRNSCRYLIGTGLAALAALSFPVEDSPVRGPLAFHAGLFVVLLVGAAFDDALARLLRIAGAVVVLVVCMVVMFTRIDVSFLVPPEANETYPLVMAAFLAAYSQLIRHRPALVMGTVVLAGWMAQAGWRAYCSLRVLVAGLDYIALSLALLGLAVAISLNKSGARSRWIAARRQKPPPLPE
jgi:hypothetical protein